jgi:hypothetical protein
VQIRLSNAPASIAPTVAFAHGRKVPHLRMP